MKVRVLIPFKNIETNSMTKLGDILNVSKERYEEMDKNQRNINIGRTEELKFFELVDPEVEETKVEVAKKEIKTEKAVKKTTKKSK